MPRIKTNDYARQEPYDAQEPFVMQESPAAPEPNFSMNSTMPERMDQLSGEGSALRFLLAGLGLVLAILLFMPWIEIASKSFSVPELALKVLSTESYIRELNFSETENAVAMMSVFGGVLGFLWLVSLGLLGVGVYKDIRSGHHVHVGFLASAILASFVVCGVFAFKAYAADSLGLAQGFFQTIADGVLKVEPMAYVTIVVGFVAFVASMFLQSRD